MSKVPIQPDESLKRLGILANGLKARLRIERDALAVASGSLVILAAHERQAKDRREGRLTVAQKKHAHGARAEILGYLGLDDYAILGLEQHGLLYAMWVARAAIESPAGNLGNLLGIILADPARAAWCRAEGARVSWEFAKAARDAETADFVRRQAAGLLGNWRPKPMTPRQHYLVTLICVRGGFSYPEGLSRGRAYDWIQRHGSHPKFWAPPPPAPDWPNPNTTQQEGFPMTQNDVDDVHEAYLDPSNRPSERTTALLKARVAIMTELATLEARQKAGSLHADGRQRLRQLRQKVAMLDAATGGAA